jgi:UDP-3-O-[3-hydroxymyristoyl] glucosamine N-acyltransferase
MVGAKVVGDASTVIKGVAGVREAVEGEITFASSPRYVRLLEKSRASAAVVSRGAEGCGRMSLLVVADPDDAFSKIIECFAPPSPGYEPGIHPTAVVADDVRLGRDVSIAAHVVIEAGSSIGDGTVIRPLVYVGHNVTIGGECLIYPNVTLREDVKIGSNCIIHSGAVIGSDGFGYVTRKGRREKIPQRGTVVIDDDVEIGACVTVDRARFGRTWIKKGTKIDNLVQIGHNVVIGENCLLVAMVGLAGSAHLGDNVMVGGQAAVEGHTTIGKDVVVGGRAGIMKDIPDGMRVSGFPAKPHREELRLAASILRIPGLFERVRELEKRFGDLEHATDNDRQGD